MVFKRIMSDQFGAIMVSVILGLGLAAIFRRVCDGDGCIVIRAPNQKELDEHVYRVGSGDEAACYRYTPNVVPCKRNE
jgi:hypothetical protein